MKSSETDRLLQRAETLRNRCEYGKALTLFRRALSAYDRRGNLPGVLECRLSIGDVCRMTGRFEEARDSYVQAITTARKIPDYTAEADARTGMGLSFRAQGDWKRSIRHFSEVLDFYTECGDRHGIAFTQWALAGALRIRGDIPGALRTYRRSLRTFRSLKDRSGAGYSLCGMGGTSRVAGLFRDSLNHYRAAHDIFDEIRDTFGKAYSFCGMGNAHRMTGNYKEALLNFRRASRLYRRIGDRVSFSYTLWSMGTTYKMLSDYGKAKEFFRLSKALFTQTRDPRGLIYCDLGFGEVAFLEGRKKTAGNFVDRALENARTHGFLVEHCHGKVLHSLLCGGNPINCYNRLGLRLKNVTIPLNIP